MTRPFHNLRKTFVALAATAMVLPTLTLTPAPAHAGERFKPDYFDANGFDQCDQDFGEPCIIQAPKFQDYSRPPQPDQRHQKRAKNDNGKWIVAGVIGLAAGAIILNEIQKKKKKRKARSQDRLIGPVVPQPVHAGHDMLYPNTQGGLVEIQPWTNAWYRWCAENYRSFNPRTGTYIGRDGYEYFCVVE